MICGGGIGGQDVGLAYGQDGTVGLWHFWAKNAHFSMFLTIKTASRKNKTIYKRF
jgi:hypothetical protein